jgi:hypothetical protein
MFRPNLAVVTLLLAALAGPSRAHSVDPSNEPPPDSAVPAEAERGGGEVSVDLEETTPGLTPEVFRSTLGEQGEWYTSARYGGVWRPRVAIGWRPYYYGSWLWTDEGWYWDSDEPFAWAVYHYGRWVLDPSWGWVWVPGYQWAPAWVTWRFGVDAVGWAPLGPGVSVYVTSYPFFDFWWTFVPCDRFVGVPIYTVAYGPRETHRHYRATSPAPPRTLAPPRDGRRTPGAAPAWGGPSRRAIEERTGRPVETARRPAGAWPGGRAERGRAPGWTHTPERAGPRERPDTRAVPRVEEGRQPGVRPEPRERPAPRGEVERPSVRPAPRGETERPSVRSTPRGEEERRVPARGSEEPRRTRNPRDR